MKTTTLTDNIYQALKDDILELRLKPGEKVSEVSLSNRFQVSRAPIRQALAKLAQEELIIIKPQIGTIVSSIPEAKILEILQIRLLLEPYAAEEAAKKIDNESIELLKESFKRFEASFLRDEESKKIYFETDSLLHRVIWKSCGNKEVKNILENYRNEINRIRISNSDLGERLIPTAAEVRNIYSAILKRSPEESRAAMYKHILNIKEAVEGVINP